MDNAYFEEVLMPEWTSRPEVLRGEVALQALPHRNIVMPTKGRRMADIVWAVSKSSGVSLIDIQSERRAHHISLPRQVAMYLCKRYTNQSLPSIGRQICKDHTTVMHGCRKVETILSSEGKHPDYGYVTGLIRRAKEEMGAD